MEQWRDIAGFEGIYQVSDLGNVRSVERDVPRPGGGVQHRKGRELLPGLVNGYLKVVLSRDGIHYQKLVHRLVAEAFIPNPDGKPCVNHKDGCKINDKARNLEWVTWAENSQHAIEHLKRNKGPRRVIRSDGCIFDSMAAAAKATGVCVTGVRNVLKYEADTAGGYGFKYAD